MAIRKMKSIKEAEHEIWRTSSNVSSHNRTIRDKALEKVAALREQIREFKEAEVTANGTE